ncbi:transcriptional regulator, TetR family [Eubacterium ruminantium]|nr:transcriptional regulator, TetR family [Eubacterium ruminantium]
MNNKINTTDNNTSKKTDLRVIKTKRAIRNAFAHLLAEKEVANITVTDIIQRAEINRKTFYNHYTGVHELVDEVEDEIVNNVEHILTELDFIFILTNPYKLFDKLTAIINSDYDFYSPLLSMSGNVSLVTKISESLRNKTKDAILSQWDVNEKELDIMLQFVFSGTFTVYQNWFNSDRTMSLETLSRITSTVCFGGISSLMKLD